MKEKKNKRPRLPEITPERKEEMRQRALQKRASLSLAYQLGFYVGEQIVSRFLPTLSVDMLQTNKVISTTLGEVGECKRLNDVWFSKRMSIRGGVAETKATEKEWEELRAYHEALEEKYLPKTIDCHFSLLNIAKKNMEEFKKGIGASLWDCDCSHYSTKPEDIQVADDEDGWFTIITIKRD